ncbi:tripartite tricarboxylate transporter TctB family protein [Ensifer adhaerens]|uniref:tripartite tricarboxylate transporter TctB family protein n=1 Tax=Ensifer adhaerens TaxID=106592 RepID=UPI0023A9723A|nr:tripartite tricarboxylate transporter TctB family protein [Ensifer adhaerens]WDZ76239.1 tripartite tricarboxylate transporter TctB family protein [Ensifer adhaerens]
MEKTESAGSSEGPRDVTQTADRIVCGAFCVLGGYICYSSIIDLDAFSQAQLGSGAIPLLVGLLMIASSLAVLFQLRSRRLVSDDVEMPTKAEGLRALSLLALTILAAAMTPLVGLVVALGLFTLIELLVLEKRSLLLSASTAIILPVGLYCLFEVLLGVPMPKGLLGI